MLRICWVIMFAFTGAVLSEDKVGLPKEILDCLIDFKDLYIRWRSFEDLCRANTMISNEEDFHKYNNRIQRCLKDTQNADIEGITRRDECRELAANTLTEEQHSLAQKKWEEFLKGI